MGSKAHIAAQERYIGFTNPKIAIDYNIEKWSDEDLRLYKKRLTYSQVSFASRVGVSWT